MTRPRTKSTPRLTVIPRKNLDENDFIRTDPRATRGLLSMVDVGDHVWDPCCGDGAIVRVLKETLGRRVVASDLIARNCGRGGTDFLKTRRLRAPAIVMNPPFKETGLQTFVQHSLDLGADLVYAFGQVTILNSIGRKKWLEDTKLSEVIILSRRPAMWYGDEPEPFIGMLDFAWFGWRRDHRGACQLKWLDVAEHGPGWEAWR